MNDNQYICADCPRSCNVTRTVDFFAKQIEFKSGYCKSQGVRIAKVITDFAYEEPVLGKCDAVFFSGCSLQCGYCQNREISQSGEVGKPYTLEQMAQLFSGKRLDLITPTHFLTPIERAIALCEAKPHIIWNTSGYETQNAVMREIKFTDVFLMDFKYGLNDCAKKYSNAADYFEFALNALKTIRANITDEYDSAGVMKKGLIVRHLVLPDCLDNTFAVLSAVKNAVGVDTVISLMSQYTPNGTYPPNRKLKPIEYKAATSYALKIGFNNGYFQEISSADSSYTPDFSNK